MTAHGSELIAIDALLRGAVDYVPKSKLANELNRAVEAALSISTETSRQQRLHQCVRFEQARYELANDPILIPPVVDHLQLMAREMGLVDDAERLRLARALVEAISNAMYHGNLELTSEQVSSSRPSAENADCIARRRAETPYRDRRVTIEATLTPDEGRFVIRDQGRGFDVRTIPDVSAAPGQLADSERRGLVLIKLFMDECRFNAAGNEITLVKRRTAAAC